MQNFSLNEVTLTEGTFADRQNLVREYLAAFDIDRLLHTFRIQAGIKSTAEPLGGWESPECLLRGHFAGHFLSACAKMAYGKNDEVLRKKADAIVDAWAECMLEDGYLSAFGKEQLDILEERENSGVWAPYYVFHKLLAGLVDCVRYLENAKALRIAEALALYLYGRFEKLSYWKIDNILRCTRVNPVNEYGGIGDALYSLYELTGNERILEFAKVFDRDYFTGNLFRGNDVLTDLHSNTHLPVVIASAHRYALTGEPEYRTAVLNFYEYIKPRTFANGNNSSKAAHPMKGGVSEQSEHWGSAGITRKDITGGESESCCAHNMERILEYLLQYGDNTLEYLNHLESLKYNAVLNSASSVTGLSQYHQPMGESSRKKFSSPYNDFWCCTGSGIEAMSELQKNIWLKNGEQIFINMFVPSVLQTENLEIEMITEYPVEERAVYVVHTHAPVSLQLAWKVDSVKGIQLPDTRCYVSKENGLIQIQGLFSEGDRIEIQIGSDITLHSMDKEADIYYLKYGQILLAKTEGMMNPGEKLKKGIGVEFESEKAKWKPLYMVEDELYSVYINSRRSSEAKDGSGAY